MNASIFFCCGSKLGDTFMIPMTISALRKVNKNSENFQQNDGEDDGAGSKRSLRCGKTVGVCMLRLTSTVAEGCVDRLPKQAT